MVPLRILHIFRAPVGGLFRHVVDLAHGQIARGHEVGIFCDSTTGGPRADEALGALQPKLALGLNRIAMRRPPHPLDAVGLFKLTQLYRQARPNVLHGHGSKGGLLARLVTLPSLDRDAVRAYTPHGGSFNYNPGTLSHRLFMSAERLLERRTDAFLFESDYVRGRFDLFVGQTAKLVRVVHNGISEEEFSPLPRVSNPFDMVFIGELRPAKGIDVLFDALTLMRREHGRTVRLLVVGSGPSGAELEAKARAEGLLDTIAFEPAQPIRQVLARGRIMVMPSRAESLPYVLLEAAAAAMPLVSTDVGGIKEIFGERSGELIPPGNPRILADTLMAKLDQPDEARRTEAEALSRQLRTGFSLDGMVDGVLAAYRDSLVRRGLAQPVGVASIGLS